MSKYRVTWWLTTQYEATVEAESEEQAWEKYSAGKFLNGISVADYSDEPYDEELEDLEAEDLDRCRLGCVCEDKEADDE